MLETLVYLSSATDRFAESDLEPILAGARRRNAAAGLTGVLLYADRSFIQVLEGDAAALEATMARIVADPRHDGVIMLYRKPIAARGFADWSMGFRRAAGQQGAFALTGPALRALAAPGGGEEVLALLRQFYTSVYRFETV